jgi:hypothetical protein
MQTRNVYISCQYTQGLEQQIQRIQDQLGRVSLEMRASTPPFNVQKGHLYLASEVNVPTFGIAIPRAVSQLLSVPAIQTAMRLENADPPVFGFVTLFREKLAGGKLQPLVEEFRKHGDLGSTVAGRLEQFLNCLTAVDLGQVKSFDDWYRLMADWGFPSGWDYQLHFDRVLGLFGCPPDLSRAVRQTAILDGQQQVSLEHFSVRWLSKALTSFNVKGCLSDVVNLAYIVVYHDHGSLLANTKSPTEEQTVDLLNRFRDSLLAGQVDRFWIPDYHIHDGDTKATAVINALRLVAETSGPVEQHIQVPPDSKFDLVADGLIFAGRNVFRDPDSENQRAFADNWETQ